MCQALWPKCNRGKQRLQFRFQPSQCPAGIRKVTGEIGPDGPPMEPSQQVSRDRPMTGSHPDTHGNSPPSGPGFHEVRSPHRLTREGPGWVPGGRAASWCSPASFPPPHAVVCALATVNLLLPHRVLLNCLARTGVRKIGPHTSTCATAVSVPQDQTRAATRDPGRRGLAWWRERGLFPTGSPEFLDFP